MPTSYQYTIVSLAFDVLSSISFAPMSGINAPSSTGGVTPLRLPALTLRGYLHVVQDGSAFFPRAFGLVRRVVLFSNGWTTFAKPSIYTGISSDPPSRGGILTRAAAEQGT